MPSPLEPTCVSGEVRAGLAYRYGSTVAPASLGREAAVTVHSFWPDDATNRHFPSAFGSGNCDRLPPIMVAWRDGTSRSADATVQHTIRKGRTDLMQTCEIIISIKPEHARHIMAGRKTVELRRCFPEGLAPGGLMLIYASSPEQALVGAARIENARRMTPAGSWRSFKKDEGFGVVLGRAVRFDEPIPVSELKERFSFSPPQSYRVSTRRRPQGRALRRPERWRTVSSGPRVAGL